ncbi:PilT/PilU family type 4a pilus ATPase [Snodgrassella communis]|uniref:Twitching motility protein PilT n=1 Tax=Snodgrassella communis TaxID=2946699 RepID=A0A836MRU5_9NEIS|nr:PilT/PilU family type 4a pilus ATPase [Snodgrassella communis]KDN14990.1 Twitching motility protein PilT [Snodgrassella communis]
MGMQKDSTNESGLSDLLADMVNHYQYPAADTAITTLTSGTETIPIVSTVAAEQLVSLAASETATTVPVAEKKPKPASYTTEINKPEKNRNTMTESNMTDIRTGALASTQASIAQERETIHIHPVLEKMAAEAVRLNAADIFISPGFPPSWKIDGKITPAPTKPLTAEETAKIAMSTMTTAQRQRFMAELDLNYSIIAKNGVRFRVNAYHEQSRIGLVLRRITTDIPTIQSLFLPPVLDELVMRKRGLIILAGPTGSGKSTTMAAMLDHRNAHSAGHILTIEDPIEYIHKPKKSIITHREIGVDTLNWDNAMQSALREAPDVVCVGEVRSDESMEYALKLAQTGHLCFFTLHASSANQAIERILNFYPEDQHRQVLMDLALNTVCIIGQRLAVKKDGKGRRAVIDLLINTATVQDYIYKGQLMQIKELMAKAGNDGMQTFDQCLFQLYADGIIDFEEALRQSDSPNDLRLRINLYEQGEKGAAIFNTGSELNLV